MDYLITMALQILPTILAIATDFFPSIPQNYHPCEWFSLHFPVWPNLTSSRVSLTWATTSVYKSLNQQKSTLSLSIKAKTSPTLNCNSPSFLKTNK